MRFAISFVEAGVRALIPITASTKQLEWLLRGLFSLLILPVPLLVGYDLFLQQDTPIFQSPSAIAAVVVASTFWSSAVLLFIRKYQRAAVRHLVGLSQAVAIALYGPLMHPDFWAAPVLVGSLSMVCSTLIGPLMLLYCLNYPVTVGTPRQRNRLLWIAFGLSPLAMALGLSRTAVGLQIGVSYSAIMIILALGILGYAHYRRAAPVARRRLRVAFFGTLLAIIPPNLLYILPPVFGVPHLIPAWAAGLFMIMAPISYVYAILQHNLFGIDRFINRTLVYTILSMSVFLLYLGPLIFITAYLSAKVWTEALVIAALTLLVGLSFDWTRRSVQHWVDRLFYGGWYDYPGVVETISAALSRSLDRDSLAEALTRQTATLMQLHPGRLWVDQPGEQPASNQFVYVFQSDTSARWVIGPRLDGDALSESDLRILHTLARQAEITLANVLLVEQLRRQLDEIRTSREALTQAQHRLLRSREEERARLARDLHDGPIQELVGLNIQISLMLSGTAGQLPVDNTLGLKETLRGMQNEVRALLADLRQVCTDLRPPMLDTLGLGAALKALGEDWSTQTGLALQLDIPVDADLRLLPGELSVNLYRVAQEALANISRHAHARQASIRLTCANTWLYLTISDDGCGFLLPNPPQALASAGHYGLAGMQERVALINGKIDIESSPGRGTKIRVVIPV